MTSIELFNELNGKTVSRENLQQILQQAKAENQTAVIYRVSKILNDYPDTKRFEMNIMQYPQGLAGAMHTGDYREALDDCGRLRKGWKFVKGNVVKVEKKEPRRGVSHTPKSQDKKSCKTCGKKYKFLIYKTQTSNKYTLAFSYADLADENKSVFDLRKTHKGKGYNEFFVINNAILLEKYKKDVDYLILSKEDFDKKEFYKLLDNKDVKKNVGKEYIPSENNPSEEKEYKITPKIRLQYPKSYTDADIIASMKKMDKFRKEASEKQKKINAEKQEELQTEKDLWKKISKKDKEDIKDLEGKIKWSESQMSLYSRMRRAVEEWSKNKADFSPFNHYKIYGTDAEYARRQYDRKGIWYFRGMYEFEQKNIEKLKKQIEKIKQKYDVAPKERETANPKGRGVSHTPEKVLPKTSNVGKEYIPSEEKTENTENQEDIFLKYVLPLYEERKANPDKKLSVKESKDTFFVESKEFWKVFKNVQTDYVKTQHLRGIIKISPKGFEMLEKNCKACEIVDKLQTKLIFSKMNGRGNESSLRNRLNDLFGKEITLESLFLEFENYSATKYELGDVAKERKVFYYGLEFSFWWQNEGLDIQISQSFADYIFTHIEDKDKALFETIKKIIDKKRKGINPKPVKKSVSSKKTDENFGLSAPQPQLSTEDFKKMKVSELRKFTLEYYNTHLKGKKTAIKNHLKEVVFVSGAGRKLLQPIYKEKVAIIEHLEQLIKNSTYNNWGNRKKTDSPDVLGYLNFKSKITIDGEKRHVRISVILDRERKTKFKTFEVGTKPKKDASIRRVAVTNPKAGQIETSSRSKNTKKSVSNKKNDKNFGLGLPLTDEIRKKAFTDKGKLRKGWYFEENGLLTDGKYVYISKDKKQIEYQLLEEKVLDKIDKKQKIRKELNDLKSDAKWKNDYELNWLNNGSSRMDFYQSLLPKLKGKISNLEKEDVWEIVENSVEDGKNGNRIFTWHGSKSDSYKKFLKKFGIKDGKAYLLNEDALFIYHFVKEAIKKEISKVRGDREKLEKKYGLAAPFPHPLTPSPKEMRNVETEKNPAVFVEESPQETPQSPTTEAIKARKGSLYQLLNNSSQTFESYQIDRFDMTQFLGDMEIKNVDSLVITLTGGQGSGKTRFAFQFMNDLAQRYKVGHISIEEHPESRLYKEKAYQYLNQNALNNIEAHDVRSFSEIDNIIRENDVIVIDSFQKIKEIDSKFEVDKDLRKKYNGKLFLVIFQQTTDGKMRGGSKSQFDGDIILFTEKFPNYQENYVYPDKNRYNPIPADQLKYNIFQQRLLPVESEEQTIENQVYDVIY